MLGPREVISGHLVQSVLNLMQCESFLVVLTCLLFAIVRSKESPRTLHGMGVPLLRSWGEERASKEFPVFYVVGAATTVSQEGRTAYAKRRQGDRDFDSTKGYPGEDGFEMSH